MAVAAKRRLLIATIVYWVLLLYIIAALIWWFIALNNQNRQATNYKLSELKMDDTRYAEKYELITSEKKAKSVQYIGEGLTFLALTLVGAVFVYRAVRRQIRMQQQQENFMMAITHELKTPIAILKLNLETLQKHQLEEPKRQKLLQATVQEANRLNTITSNILVSSQLEGQRYRFEKEELDFSQLVMNVVQNFKSRFPDRTWLADITPEADLTGDALLLQILVSNLLENAVKYSPRNSPIKCRVHKKNYQVIVEVADAGPGIPDAEKKRVFEKFYRIGNENTRTASGTGLGLYLCKKIAADHNADIKVTNNLPTGCVFTVSFTT